MPSGSSRLSADWQAGSASPPAPGPGPPRRHRSSHPCTSFVQGACSRGDRCAYSHACPSSQAAVPRAPPRLTPLLTVTRIPPSPSTSTPCLHMVAPTDTCDETKGKEGDGPSCATVLSAHPNSRRHLRQDQRHGRRGPLDARPVPPRSPRHASRRPPASGRGSSHAACVSPSRALFPVAAPLCARCRHSGLLGLARTQPPLCCHAVLPRPA